MSYPWVRNCVRLCNKAGSECFLIYLLVCLFEGRRRSTITCIRVTPFLIGEQLYENPWCRKLTSKDVAMHSDDNAVSLQHTELYGMGTREQHRYDPTHGVIKSIYCSDSKVHKSMTEELLDVYTDAIHFWSLCKCNCPLILTLASGLIKYVFPSYQFNNSLISQSSFNRRWEYITNV